MFLYIKGFVTFEKDVVDWITLIIGRDFRKYRAKVKRMDRVSMNYVIDALGIIEKDVNKCRRSATLRKQTLGKSTRFEMQQDINIIKATEEDIALHENGVVSELKQIAEEKSNLAERQRTIIENQKDIIFKLNNEKDRMQRDVNTLKQEMEMTRSRKLFIYRFTFFKINSFYPIFTYVYKRLSVAVILLSSI